MADSAAHNVGVKNSMSLMAFARSHGKPSYGTFTNEAGEKFSSLIFTSPEGDRTFCGFSSKLGTLSPDEVTAMRNELQVVELESGNFKVCKQGENAWLDLDWGL